MHTHPDFEDFLRLLEANRVEYMIVGGYAVAYHGFPRFTKDLGENLGREPIVAASGPGGERLLPPNLSIVE